MRKDMKILVTGGAGFIGSHLVNRLRCDGHHVIVIDRKKCLITEIGYHQIDILSDFQHLRKVFRQFNPEYVVHLAAYAGVRDSILRSDDYTRNNVSGFENVLFCCNEVKVKHLLYASSSSVYGHTDGLPTNESYLTDHPTSIYAATKKMNEIQAQAYHSLYGMQITGMRFFTVYGPGGRPEMAVYKFAQSIHEGIPIKLYGSNTIQRSFTYVDDIVEAIVRLIPKPVNHTIYNIGNPENYSLSRLITLLENELFEKAIINPLAPQKGDVPTTFCDCSKLYHHTGYIPHTTLEAGVKRFVDWFLSNGRK